MDNIGRTDISKNVIWDIPKKRANVKDWLLRRKDLTFLVAIRYFCTFTTSYQHDLTLWKNTVDKGFWILEEITYSIEESSLSIQYNSHQGKSIYFILEVLYICLYSI